MPTGAGSAGAACTALALSVILSCGSINHNGVIALLGLDDVESIAVSLLHTLGLVSTITVSAARHGD